MLDVPESPESTKMVIPETGTLSAEGRSGLESFVWDTLIEQWSILEA